MTRNISNFLMIVGLILTFGAVGGIENSTDTNGLITSLLFAIVSLAIMGCGVLGMRVLDSRGE